MARLIRPKRPKLKPVNNHDDEVVRRIERALKAAGEPRLFDMPDVSLRLVANDKAP